MTTIPSIAFPAVSGGADQVSVRRAMSGLIVRHTDGSIRTGILPAHTGQVVTARSDMGVNVSAFRAVAQRDGGALLIANPGTLNVPLPAGAPSSGTSRIDVIYAKQNENALHGADADDLAFVGVLTGSESGLPSAPDISTVEGAVELAQVLVPSSASATNAPGVAITQTHRYTAASGGVVIARDEDEMNAYLAPDGAMCNRLDSADVWRRKAGAWVNGDVPLHAAAIRTTEQTIPNNIWTPIVFNAPGPLNGFTYSSAGLTALEGGTYLLEVNLSFYVNAVGYRSFQVKKNGAVIEPVPFSDTKLNNGSSHSTSWKRTGTIELEPGDALTLEVHQSRGGNLNTRYEIWMRIMRLSEYRLFAE